MNSEIWKKNWIWFVLILVFLLPSLVILFFGSSTTKNYDFAISIFTEIFGILILLFIIEHYIKDFNEKKWSPGTDVLYTNLLIRIRLFLMKMEFVLLSYGQNENSSKNPLSRPGGSNIDVKMVYSMENEEFFVFIRELPSGPFISTLESTAFAARDFFPPEVFSQIQEVTICNFYLEEALLPFQISSPKEEFLKVKELFIQFIREVLQLKRTLEEINQPAASRS